MLQKEEIQDSPENLRNVQVDENDPSEVISDQKHVISNSTTNNLESNHSNVDDHNNNETNHNDDNEAVVADEWNFDDETHVVKVSNTIDQHHDHAENILVHESNPKDSDNATMNNKDDSTVKDLIDHLPSPIMPSMSSFQSQEAGDDDTFQESIKEDVPDTNEGLDSPQLEMSVESIHVPKENETFDAPLLESSVESIHDPKENDEGTMHNTPQSNPNDMMEQEDIPVEMLQQDEPSNHSQSISDHAIDESGIERDQIESKYNMVNEVPIVSSDLDDDGELDNHMHHVANIDSNHNNVPTQSCTTEVQDIDLDPLYQTTEKVNDAELTMAYDDKLDTVSECIPLSGNVNDGGDYADEDQLMDGYKEESNDQHVHDSDDGEDVPIVEDQYLTSENGIDSLIPTEIENVQVTTFHDSSSKPDDVSRNESEEIEPSPDSDLIYEANDSNAFTNEEENALNLSMVNSTKRIDSEAEALDTMYDDSETETESQAEFIASQTPSVVSNLNNTNDPAVPQYAIEKFMSQLERIHKEHELELQDMEKKHISHMQDLKEKLRIAESKQSKSAVSKQAIANHDKCLRELRDLEKNFLQQLEHKDDIIVQVTEQKTLLEQRIREMIKESDELNISLQARKSDVNQIEQNKREIGELKIALEKSQTELQSSQEAYSTLKERVKEVATELKDRRVECRKLSSTVNEMTSQNASIESAKNEFESKANKLSLLVQSKDDQIEDLTNTITNLRMELSQKEKQLIDTGSIGNKALMEYKKKAQASLSNANARAATANQAREDAEIDAANARAEAENAIKDLEKLKAEKELLMHSKETELQEMYKNDHSKEQEITRLVKQVSELNEELSSAQNSAHESQKHLDDLIEECNTKLVEIEKEKEKSFALSQDLAITRIKNDDLEKEVALLKEELEEKVSNAFKANQNDSLNDTLSAPNRAKHKDPKSLLDLGDSDGTIYLLQEELKASNEAIQELREALANALSKNVSSSLPGVFNPTTSSTSELSVPDRSGSNPLFFALEKQSELKQARDEIARLVSLLGEAEFSKSDALEELEEMRQKMNEAESRLRRYEKLGPAANNNLAGGSFNRKSFDSKISSHSDSAANLEYLKNVILRFMKSTTLNEKKALIPVIAAVLELTPDEQILALQGIEKSAGISGIGTSLIENVQSKGMAGLFG